MVPRKYPPEAVAYAEQRYAAGFSVSAIARELGIPRAAVQNWRWRLQWPKPAVQHGPKHSGDIKVQARDWYQCGLSTPQIAEKLNLKPTLVSAWAQQGGWTAGRADLNASRDEVVRAIARISAQRDLTAADHHALDKLTRSLERLDKARKAEEMTRTPKKKPASQAQAQRDALLAKALHTDFGLYPYQREFLTNRSRFRAVLKARQIGFSWLLALDALLEAAGGTNAVIVSASQDQADLLIGYAQLHAIKLGLEPLALSRSELVLESGGKVISRPANVRTVQGFSGSLYLDEFAWMPDARKMWEAAVPVIVAVKGRLTVCSTPYDQNSLFYQLMEDPEGRYPQFSRTRIGLQEAIAQGLPVDAGELRGLFDSDAYQRLFELAWFDDAESYFTIAEVQACVGDCLNVTTQAPLYGGYDVGRTTDASELVLVESDEKVTLRVRKTFKRMPFADQKREIEQHLVAYRVQTLHIDATGMGANLAEDCQRRFPGIVRPVWFTQALKEELAVNLKKLFEERRLIIPNDPGLIAQIHGIKRIAKAQGFSYDSGRNKEIGHADAFWALALACRELGFGGRRIVTARVF
jgi:phage FluMu gp28-like protein/transposase-like protein